MKKISLILASIALLATSSSFAQTRHTSMQDMLERISKINSSYHPIVGTSKYTYKCESRTFVVLRLYDNSGFMDVDPEHTDVQAVFSVEPGTKVVKLEKLEFNALDLKCDALGD